MKLFWHIGPHKTGTTSIQLALNGHASSAHASYYYPPVGEYGPGHAYLAWRLIGLNKIEKQTDALHAELDRARREGFEKVVLSSEEFSRAINTDEGFAPLAKVTADYETELIFTLRPLATRVYPELQELIKHGRILDVSSTDDVILWCANQPGLRADFLPAAIEGIKPSAVSVVMVQSTSPLKLFDDFSAILGETVTPSRNAQANASYPYIKTIWLDAINRHAKLPPAQARALVDAAFHAAGKQLDTLPKIPYPPLPRPLQRYLDGVWDLQLAYIRAMSEARRLRCL